jgi:transcription initiation factor IIF auxiliary subunit
MALSIRQDSKYLGHDRWKWSVWLEGSSEELDHVKQVMYVLHPTFHNPVRIVDNRATKFRLETSGWGTFTIHAKVVDHAGRETYLDHPLTLLYPDGTPTPA